MGILLAIVVLWAFGGGSSLVVGLAALYLVALPLLLFGLTFRRLRTMMRPGCVWVSGADQHGLLLGTPDGHGVVRYDAITWVRPRFGIVLMRTGGGVAVLPPTLMPPEMLAYVRSQIGGDRRRS